MTTSKVMRAVRDHSTRSEGTAPLAGLGGSMRQGARGSQASEGSSDASETGVVNSPMLDKQQRPSGGCLPTDGETVCIFPAVPFCTVLGCTRCCSRVPAWPACCGLQLQEHCGLQELRSSRCVRMALKRTVHVAACYAQAAFHAWIGSLLC